MVCCTILAVRSAYLPRYDCSSQLTLPSSLSQLQSALNPALFQPLLPLQLSQLLLGSAFGVPSLPLVVIQTLILKAFLICIFQGQYAPEFANSAEDKHSFGRFSITYTKVSVAARRCTEEATCEQVRLISRVWRRNINTSCMQEPTTCTHGSGPAGAVFTVILEDPLHTNVWLLQHLHPLTRSARMQQLCLLLAKLCQVSINKLPQRAVVPKCDDHQLETVFKVLQVIPVFSHGPFSFLWRILSS